MKRLLLISSMLWGFAYGQSIGYFRYDSVRFEKVGGNSELILLNSTRDSLGVLYNMGNGRTRFRTLSSLGLSQIVANGITKSGDTAILGGTIDRATHIQLENQQTVGAQYSYLHLANRPEAEALIQEVSLHPTVSIYNPTSLAAEGLYKESENDTAYLHYGGRFVSVVRNVFDSTSTRFSASNKSIILPSNGFEGVYQFMIPRDTTTWTVGRDGQSANVIHSQWDLGDTYGYNTNIIPANGIRGFPLTTTLSSIDLMRNIDVTRSHKMSGAGVSGYTSRYKSYQNSINMSTYEAGNYTDSIFGFTAYGDTYPELSGATKAKTLAVWNVKNAFGFYVHPQYRYTNTVDNGYGVYAAGDSDINVFKGFTYFGNNSPVRQNNTEGLRYRVYANGKGRFTDSLISDGNIEGFIVQGQAVQIGLNPALGTQPALGFFRTDSMSRQQAVIFAETIGQPSSRYIAIRIGGNYTEAQNPTQSTGQYIAFETGPSQANVSRISRNGNWTIGNSAAILAYRWWKKHAVDGGGVYRDTLRLEVAPLQVADDTTNYKPVVRHITTGDLLTMPWMGGSGGGGGSGITIGTTTITSGTTSRILYNNAGVAGEYTLTGTGTAVAMGTSPVFTTDITTPKINGSTSSGGTLTLMSTTNATKGKILFGTSAYDEVNNRLGIGTASPAVTLEVSGTAMAMAYQTTGVGENGNFLTGATTGMRGSTLTPYLFPGGAGTDFRVSVNGSTSTTSTAGRDIADLVLTGSVTTEAGSSTHPRAGTLFVGSKVMTNGAGATDTLYGAYINGPATGVTPVGSSWNTIFNLGNVLVKYGKLVVGVGAASAGIGASFISTVAPGSGADAGIFATGGIITEFSSGNHTTLAGAYLSAPTITGGSATATKATTLYIDGAPSATVSDRVYSMYVNNGEARFNASLSKAIAGVSSTTTLDNTWYTVLAEDAGGSYTINLPAAASCTGRVYIIKKINSSANTITVDANASETIDGATTVALTAQWTTFQIQSNGTNWFVLNP